MGHHKSQTPWHQFPGKVSSKRLTKYIFEQIKRTRQMLLYDEFENAIAGKFPIRSGTFSKKKNNSYTYRDEMMSEKDCAQYFLRKDMI